MVGGLPIFPIKGRVVMSLIGCKVRHRTWGEGTVESHAEIYITVRFAGDDEGDITKNFIFPNALVDGILAGADEEAVIEIEKAISDSKCSECGAQNVLTVEVDGKRLCPSCKNKYAIGCARCGTHHYKNVMVSVYESLKSYDRKQVCRDCAEEHSFICEKCNGRYFNNHRGPIILSARDLCMICAEELSKQCSYCNQVFERDKGAMFYRSQGNVYVCPSCMNDRVFTCSRCGDRELKTELVDTKYVPANKMICSSCVSNCSACGEVIVIDRNKGAFGDWFCPDCWENKVSECSFCGTKFLPKVEENQLCPDCVEMEAYVSRLQKIDYLADAYKEIRYYQLEYMDRCDLFTKLFESCVNKTGGYAPESENPYCYLKLRLSNRHTLVVTYLPSSVTGKIKHALDITMTEFRSSSGSRDVWMTIDEWSESCTQFMDTSAGKMRILNYPIRLRVQTDYDKNYGKQWNGPYDYIEIGNYGDTTKFWIIGLLES